MEASFSSSPSASGRCSTVRCTWWWRRSSRKPNCNCSTSRTSIEGSTIQISSWGKKPEREKWTRKCVSCCLRNRFFKKWNKMTSLSCSDWTRRGSDPTLLFCCSSPGVSWNTRGPKTWFRTFSSCWEGSSASSWVCRSQECRWSSKYQWSPECWAFWLRFCLESCN